MSCGKACNEPADAGIPPACCTLAVDGAEKKRLVAMFKAAGNPVRFEIIQFLVTHPGCITGDIVRALPLAQATVSQHLKVLRETGWIEGEIDGPAVCYWLGKNRITWLRETLNRIL